MTALLTDNLPLLAGAPNGVKKLRELVLELAVRGKLVPQDSSDKPASALLKRIAEEKAQLVAEGKIKKQKPLAEISDEEKPFSLPAKWCWARAEDVSLAIVDCPHSTPKFVGSGKLCLDTNSFKQGRLVEQRFRYVDSSTFTERNSRLQPMSGDIVFAREGSVGESVVIPVGVECCLGQRVMLFRPHLTNSDYFRLAISEPSALSRILALHKGIGAKHVNVADMRAALIPLPPLAEQHRIVAKVDELMALCDRLEAQQADAESAHAQLVQALLDSLIQEASGATDLTARDGGNAENAGAIFGLANWQRLAEHFHTLFTTEPSIDALKQTLLQLAVMGKLVPQDPSDEPASELLKRIAEEKSQLVAQGMLKKQKPLAEIGEEEIPFELPNSWAWTRLGNICAIKGELVRPEDFPALRQVAPDCIEKGTGRLTDNRTVKESGVKGPNSRFFAGQIVYSKIRPSLSKAVLVDFDGLCSADMYPIDAFISSKFLLKEILSEVFLEQVRIAENRIKMPKLNQESLTSFVLPIPPLAEQHRIVAKVDQLMALCDQLKTRLTQAHQLNEQLASTLVEQAVA